MWHSVRTVLVRSLRTTSTAFCAYDRNNDALPTGMCARVLTQSRAGRPHSHRNQGQVTDEWQSAFVTSTTVVFLSIVTYSSSPSPTALVLSFFFKPVTSWSASFSFLSLSPPIQLRPGRWKCIISTFDSGRQGPCPSSSDTSSTSSSQDGIWV